MATTKPQKSKERVYQREHSPEEKKGASQIPNANADEDPSDDPLFDGFASAEIGSMPELMALLQDDEVLNKFQCPTTTKYLRQISMDPSVIDSLLDTPEIKFLVDKIKAQYAKMAAQK